VFAGVRWSRDGPTADARIIATARQKTGATKKPGARGDAYTEASGSGECSPGYNKGKKSAADTHIVASGYSEQEGGPTDHGCDARRGQAPIAARH
jgi:hypothetical protein